MCVCFDVFDRLMVLLALHYFSVGEKEVLNCFLISKPLHLALPYNLALWKEFLLNIQEKDVSIRTFSYHFKPIIML